MEYWHIILESIIETAKMLPLLFVVYYLIELLEFKYAFKFENNRLLRGNASPVIGSLIGSVPQCGFSVISTDLFSKKTISVGALIAVYISTSDEAIPLLIANPKSIKYLLLLLCIKIVFGIVMGYVSLALYNVIFKRNELSLSEIEHLTDDVDADEHLHGGCCHHHLESKTFDWLHPLLHCLKIFAFILVVNVLMGFVTHIWIGEDALKEFLSSSIYLQPLLAVLIGLIPNCASSVCLTELFMVGGLSFGALVAGLSVNAGLGLIVLLKQNKNVRENIFIIATLIIPSLILGYALLFI